MSVGLEERHKNAVLETLTDRVDNTKYINGENLFEVSPRVLRRCERLPWPGVDYLGAGRRKA